METKITREFKNSKGEKRVCATADDGATTRSGIGYTADEAVEAAIWAVKNAHKKVKTKKK